MKPFRFHLQTVLELREEALKQAQLDFAIEEQKRVAIVQKIESAHETIQHALKDYHHRLEEGFVPIHEANGFSHYIQQQRDHIGLLKQKLKQQEVAMITVREKLNQAHIDQKSLEMLKEKYFKRHQKEIEKQEEVLLAEIALNQYRKAQHKSTHSGRQAAV